MCIRDRHRKLRIRDASKFHVQLCLAMLLMLIMFLGGINHPEHLIGCTIASLLIQYFTLTTVFWMGAEAVLMFKKLVIVFGSISTTFIVCISLICWGMYMCTTPPHEYHVYLQYINTYHYGGCHPLR